MIGRLALLAAGVVAAAAGAAAVAKKRAERDAAQREEAPGTAAPGRFDTSEAVEGGVGAAGDELQTIKGVGKVSEQGLRDIEVTTFAQVAAWSPEELEDVAGQIKVSPERIRREDWVGQAQALAEDAD